MINMRLRYLNLIMPSPCSDQASSHGLFLIDVTRQNERESMFRTKIITKDMSRVLPVSCLSPNILSKPALMRQTDLKVL